LKGEKEIDGRYYDMKGRIMVTSEIFEGNKKCIGVLMIKISRDSKKVNQCF
jgi:hypothetical protein